MLSLRSSSARLLLVCGAVDSIRKLPTSFRWACRERHSATDSDVNWKSTERGNIIVIIIINVKLKKPSIKAKCGFPAIVYKIYCL